jgi:hypothetical protein
MHSLGGDHWLDIGLLRAIHLDTLLVLQEIDGVDIKPGSHLEVGREADALRNHLLDVFRLGMRP